MWTLWTVLILTCSPVVWTMCNSTFSVPVPEAQLLDDGRLLDVQENVTYEKTDFWHNGSEYLSCPCNRKACIFKCCPLDDEMSVAEEGSCAPATYEPIPSNLHLLHHNPCSGPRFRLSLPDFTLTQAGQLISNKDEILLEAFTFCVDRETDGDIVALVCREKEFSRATGGTTQILAGPLFVFSLANYATRLIL